MPLDVHQMNEAIGVMISSAQRLPDNELPIQNQAGAIVATLKVHDLPTRPKDMPRALRPKVKLSKRQRAAAKRTKLAA